MKKFARSISLVNEIRVFGCRNGLLSNLYTTNAKLPSELLRQILPVGDQKVSIVPILDRWVEEGRSLDAREIRAIVRKLHDIKRFNHALQMTDKRYFELSSSDVALRLQLIYKTQGMKQAERYFDSLSQNQIDRKVYSALLNCYASPQWVREAEAVMQKIRDLGYAKRPLEYNFMLNICRKAGNMETFDALLKEMEENGIARDKFTHSIQLSAYSAVMDIEKMDKIVKVMESDPNFVSDWASYTTAAAGYRKAGLLDKAFEMLKKAEACPTSKPYCVVYNQLLTQYANIGRKDEVLRVWLLYKKKPKVDNEGYKCLLISLVKLGEIEMAEEFFDEWESQKGLTYDMNIPNVMIHAYSAKGLVEKAEAFIDRAISKGGKPNAWTWQHLVKTYIENEQPQKAVEMMKKAFVTSETKWKPDMELFNACLEYLKGVGDAAQSEEFAKLLKVRNRNRNIVSLD